MDFKVDIMTPEEIVQKVLDAHRFKELNPVQKEALRDGLLGGASVVVSAPTASGKTVIAEIAALDTIVNMRKKVVYIVPLKALANEKYRAFRDGYAALGVRVAISVGDLDSSDGRLSNYDIIVATSEKMDSLMRHGAPWLSDVGLVVADEVHLLNDTSRGPTLEITLTRIRKAAKARILALSATIRNAKEIAAWLDAKLVVSDYRPVALHEGVFVEGRAHFPGRDGFDVPDGHDAEVGISLHTVNQRKQAILFVATRKAAEAAAENISGHVRGLLGGEDVSKLSDVARKIGHALTSPTRQCRRLAGCVAGGVAFHHAGLVASQRSLVEEHFRAGLIKIICATPTLSMGLNMPAYRVVIRDIKRYYERLGMNYIPVLEYAQMSGRAGRPGYDTEGESLIVAKSQAEAEELVERYINGEPEEIYSKLAVEPVLRMHILSLVSSGAAATLGDLGDFFGRTLYGFHYGNTPQLTEKINDIVGLLQDYGFIISHGGRLESTALGRRVSELYLDPKTARMLMDGIGRAFGSAPLHAWLELICNAPEMYPLLSVRRNDFAVVNAAAAAAVLLHDKPAEWDIGYDDFLRAFRTATMLRSWADEKTEEQLLEEYGVTPGELHSKLETADWLFYSLQELGMVMGRRDAVSEARKSRVMMRYGVREELLPLMKIEGVGRARGRKLFNAGFTTLEMMRSVPTGRLAQLVGEKTAASITEQLSGLKAEKPEKQTTLAIGGQPQRANVTTVE